MTALKFRKRPVVIEAMQWTGKNTMDAIDWIVANGPLAARWDEGDPDVGVPESIAIDTLEGTMRAMVGDWIIRGIQNEFYPCKPEIFEATYEPVADEAVHIVPHGPTKPPYGSPERAAWDAEHTDG